MVIILIILSFILCGYSLFLINKLTKETNISISKIKIHYEALINETSLYLLHELDHKIKINEEWLKKLFFHDLLNFDELIKCINF